MMKPLGIYIHIPFCLSKCLYCGFYSKGGATPAEQGAYIDGLIEDIFAYGKAYADRYLVDTVFIGGGTPSCLPAAYIERVMTALRRAFVVDEKAEITIESNPRTLSRDKLTAYRAMGINRLSIGLQSFDAGCLAALGRVHTAEDFLENFQTARACGFDNINMDLMFAVPGHTEEVWAETLRRAVALKPEHISFYSLQIEEGTPFYRMLAAGEIEEIPDETDRAMYHNAIEILCEAGYEHYEISNAALPGYACRHNLKYWSMAEYLGIGSSASSYIEGVRFTEEPVMAFHENSREDDMSEFVFTGLRKRQGIRLQEFEERFGQPLWQVYGDRRAELDEFFRRGDLLEDAGRLRLSEAGIDISNAIMAVFV